MRARALASLVVLMLASSAAQAQLISPGKLSTAHAELEGMRQCTQCHELGQRGASNQRCLGCHTMLRARIAQRRGYHASVQRDECASCHKDHLGRGVSPIRFDSTSFRHGETGYALKGAHAQQQCRACHAPAYIVARDVKGYRGGANFLKVTYLGLATGCASCHAEESPHGRQFGTRACQECHAETDWQQVGDFDHDAARFRLTGAHVKVECGECHTRTADGKVRYQGLSFGSCADCHRDPHKGAMTGTCARCHGTADWRLVERRAVASSFDHSRTKFVLHGAHLTATCAACHAPSRDPQIRLVFAAGSERSTFRQPVVRSCASCHVDPHPKSYSQAGARQSCESCHGLNGWRPVDYEIRRHNEARNFVLDGAHLATPCNACHTRASAPPRSCNACHAKQDPHNGAFGKQSCGECHETSSFLGAELDHERVKDVSCASCHARQDPHRNQFAGKSCGGCHETGSFRVQRFDHTATRFPLDKTHLKAACADCHRSESDAAGTFVRYRPVRTACKDCHGAST